jgi:ABC-type transport system involved in multi-copper enzyme maturation permease subunit
MLSMIAIISSVEWEFAVEFFVISSLIVVAVISAIASATALTSEREKHSFEILMSSPVTAKTIVMAKFMGVLKLVMPILVCIVIWTIIGAASAFSIGIQGYQQGMFSRCQPSYRNLPNLIILPIFDLLIVSFLVFLPMIIVIGLYFSAKQHRNASAIFLTFMYFVGWSALPLPVAFALMKSSDSFYSNLFEVILDYAGSLCPISAFFMICGQRSAFCMPLCLSLIVVWILLLWRLITRFDRIIGRQ